MEKITKINISNKFLYPLVTICLVFLLLTFVYAGYVSYSTRVGHNAEEFGDGTIANTLTILAGKVGIGTTNPQAELHIIGRIMSDATNETDPDNTVVTKSYLESSYRYTTCGWRPGEMCNDGEIANGRILTPTAQIKCCGTSPIECDPTNWTTYDTYCKTDCSNRCGLTGGFITYDQRRTMADCLVEYQIVTTSTPCTLYCYGSCSGGGPGDSDSGSNDGGMVGGGGAASSGGAGATCFSYNELVLTPNGGVKISELKQGELVISYDEANDLFTTSVVDQVIIHDGNLYPKNDYSQDPLINLIVKINGELVSTKVTQNHRYYSPTNNEYKPIGDFEIGEIVKGIGENGEVVSKQVIEDGNQTVYNLHLTEGPNNYIVNGVVVHNIK